MGKLRHTAGPQVAHLRTALKELTGVETRVGYFSSNKYEDGTPVAYVASIQEFGHGPIPPRPFFRPTIAAQSPAWRELIARGSKGVVNGTRTAYQLMDMIGLQAAGDIRKTISEIQAPPLSVLTLLARKHRMGGGKITGGKQLGELSEKGRQHGPPDVSGVSTKPLVDTRILLPTLTHITSQK